VLRCERGGDIGPVGEVDGADNSSRLTVAKQGYAQIVERMQGKPWMSEVLAGAEKAGAGARSGDASLFRRDLAVNCTPAQGGSATDLSSVELSLREAGQPAVALLIARPNPNTLPVPEGSEERNFIALISHIQAGLGKADAGPASSNVTATGYGREFLTVCFLVNDLGKAVPIARRLAEADQPYAGSFLIVWDGAKMRRILL